MNGAPGEIRTPDRLVRSQVLYPAELRARREARDYPLALSKVQVYEAIRDIKKAPVWSLMCVAESEGLFGAMRLTPAGPAYGRSLAKNARVEPKASHQNLIHCKIKKAPWQGPFLFWRRARDSNPRWALTHTPLAGARLQPLGQLS